VYQPSSLPDWASWGNAALPEPEAIAHHFAEAGLNDLAIEWWG
jgi:hypothetical protein